VAAQADEVDLDKEGLPAVESIVASMPVEQQGRFGSMALIATVRWLWQAANGGRHKVHYRPLGWTAHSI
jgi:hypothetical protein